jgi:RNA polymerase sigma-70 factor (ECF subfamily)
MSMINDFEPLRQFLIGIAYSMLGSLAEAEDVVQDAFLRWSATDRQTVDHPRAFLARVVSRLCLDRMKSATSRREHYVGTWLPEPMVTGGIEPMVTEGAEPGAADISVALLLTLERLSPLERAAFLLHDVFDMDYAEIAKALGRSEAACRQLAARARENVREERPRFAATEEGRAKLTEAFAAAIAQQDIEPIAKLLADHAILYQDGGGKRPAARHPIRGKDNIVQFLTAVRKTKTTAALEHVERVHVNGLPGFLIRTSAGLETMSFEIADDQIIAIYSIRNPDKLRHLS